MKELHGSIILGLKIVFKDIWENIGSVSIPSCHCEENDMSKRFCCICGSVNSYKIVPQYYNLLTHTITSYRDIDSMYEFLDKTNVSVFDQSPEGYTDEPVFIYLKTPNCKVDIMSYEPVKFYLFDNGFDMSIIREELRKTIDTKLFSKAEYGIWFVPHVHEHPLQENEQEIINRMERLLTFFSKDSKIDD